MTQHNIHTLWDKNKNAFDTRLEEGKKPRADKCYSFRQRLRIL